MKNSLTIKPGVDLNELHFNLVLVLPIIVSVFAAHGSHTTITCGNDGEHMEGSMHYELPLRALDFRIWFVEDVQSLANSLRAALGPQYDVVVEETHVHVEYDLRNP